MATAWAARNGAIEVLPGVNLTLNGNELLDAETTYNVGTGGSLWLGGALSGTGPLTKTGAWTVGVLQRRQQYLHGRYADQGRLGPLGQELRSDFRALQSGHWDEELSFNNFGTTATVTDFGTSFELNGPDLTVNGGSLYNLNGYNEHVLSLHLNNGGSVQTGTWFAWI